MKPLKINKQKKHRNEWVAPVFLVLVLLFPIALIMLSGSGTAEEEIKEVEVVEIVEEKVKHVELPDEVRGIYWTAGTAGNKRADELIEYMVATGLNSVVIDLKTDVGLLAFEPNDEDLKKYEQKNILMKDLDGVLQKLYENNIYRIARIAVMRDGVFGTKNPEVAMRTASGNFWYDAIGSIWVDPASEKVSDYAIELAEEAYSRGFDEVQFDYVRFASDGAISAIRYPVYNGVESKVAVMQRFFKKVGLAMRDASIPSSFDLFGMTYFSHNDFNIGQRLVDVFNYTDFVSPMVYPSHYPDGFRGFANPAENPYQIVKISLDEGVKIMEGVFSGSEEELRAKTRPWIQDFDIGAYYTAPLIEAQIKAARDAGASGWILWNARNVYEPANYKL
jgi:hypothetical protein